MQDQVGMTKHPLCTLALYCHSTVAHSLVILSFNCRAQVGGPPTTRGGLRLSATVCHLIVTCFGCQLTERVRCRDGMGAGLSMRTEAALSLNGKQDLLKTNEQLKGRLWRLLGPRCLQHDPKTTQRHLWSLFSSVCLFSWAVELQSHS